MVEKTPTLTTATACNKALTGVGVHGDIQEGGLQGNGGAVDDPRGEPGVFAGREVAGIAPSKGERPRRAPAGRGERGIQGAARTAQRKGQVDEQAGQVARAEEPGSDGGDEIARAVKGGGQGRSVGGQDAEQEQDGENKYIAVIFVLTFFLHPQKSYLILKA